MFWDIFTLRKVADLLFMVHRPFVNRDRIVTLAIAKGKLGLGWICFTRTRNLDRERETGRDALRERDLWHTIAMVNWR